jgi:hypoxanthine phosphoribosyltransferase
MSKIYLSPTELHLMMNQLASKIIQYRRSYKMIVGIANGGLNISNCLSYFLNIPHKTITIRFRDGIEHKTDCVESEIHHIEKPFLLVDDIIDSGATLRFFKQFEYVQGADFDVATLHWCKENSGGEKPDFYVATKNISDWIIYPWEKEYNERITNT